MSPAWIESATKVRLKIAAVLASSGETLGDRVMAWSASIRWRKSRTAGTNPEFRDVLSRISVSAPLAGMQQPIHQRIAKHFGQARVRLPNCAFWVCMRPCRKRSATRFMR